MATPQAADDPFQTPGGPGSAAAIASAHLPLHAAADIGQIRRPRLRLPARSLVVVPTICFILTSISFAFLWAAKGVPAGFAVCLLLTSLPVSMPRDFIKSGAVEAGKMLPVGMVLFGIVAGMVTGVYAHEKYTAPYYAMALGRTYDDVLASTPGAAYADAGKIRFADSSSVQVDLSIGYRLSPTYCVAPILDSGDAQLRTVAFWATGKDCCPGRGSFMCGAGQRSARGGVRVRPAGIFAESELEFGRAIKQAAKIASLAVDQDPILLEWVEDPEAEERSKLLGTFAVVSVGSVVFALLALCALLLTSSQRSKETAEAGLNSPMAM